MVYRQLNLRLFANAAVELGAWALRRRRRLRVVGQSMAPTLNDGEFVLVSERIEPRAGAIVTARRSGSTVEIIKRVSQIDSAGVWLLSDNAQVGTDSRSFGALNPSSVTGVVTIILNRPMLGDEGLPVGLGRW